VGNTPTFIQPIGTGVAIVTPFAVKGNCDESLLEGLLERLITSGVDFLVPLGTTAETPTLSSEEKELILQTVFQANNNRLPIWIGCGGNHTVGVAQQMQDYADRYPAAGFLSVSPYYNRPTQEGIYQHFKYLAESSPLPILLYNVPARTGRGISPETTVRLATEFPKIVGIKEASADLSQGMAILQGVPEDFVVLSGDDNLALASMAVGYSGCVSVTANLWPRTFSSMIRAALEMDFVAANALQQRLLPFYDLLFEEGNPAGVKAALSILGFGTPEVRLPLVPASEHLTQKLKAALVAFGSE